MDFSAASLFQDMYIDRDEGDGRTGRWKDEG
jgi:hypothetical protein